MSNLGVKMKLNIMGLIKGPNPAQMDVYTVYYQ